MADSDLRQFMHELLTRFERRTQAMERRLDAGTAVLVEMRAEIRENTSVLHEMKADIEACTAAITDMRGAIQANTRAVLHVLDELRGPGPAQA